MKNINDKKMKILKVGETFTEGAFQVLIEDKVIFTASTNKACVLFIAKSKKGKGDKNV